MNDILNLKKTGVYWWGLLTALIFIIPENWIQSFADFIRSISWLKKGEPPLIWFDNFGLWIDSITQSLAKQVKFDPKEALIFIGPFGIANLFISLIMGGILIFVVFVAYRRAVKTEGIIDDLLAMIFIYIVLRVLGLAAESLNIPAINFFRTNAPTSYLLVIFGFMILTLIRGPGSKDSRVFFKVLFEALIVSMLIMPNETIGLLAAIIELPPRLFRFLHDDPAIKGYFLAVATVWALLGVYLTTQNIYTAGKPPAQEKGISGEIGDVQGTLEKLKKKVSG